MKIRTTCLLFTAILAAGSLPALAQQSSVKDKITAAMASDIRTEAETARDRNRKPVETLEFFGLKDDMRVLELMPGGGWYTKLLAPTLRDNGELFVAIGTTSVEKNLVSMDGFDHVKVLQVDAERDRNGPFRTSNISAFEFGVSNIDIALTFRNMHNFSAEGRRNINAAVFKSLKSGGLYGVVDHSKRHMEPMTAENRRRVDPMQITEELLDVGFELLDFSDLHYRPDDELRFEVGRKTVTGNTDRFTLLFRKP
jgi:predicted methyltransferase